MYVLIDHRTDWLTDFDHRTDWLTDFDHRTDWLTDFDHQTDWLTILSVSHLFFWPADLSDVIMAQNWTYWLSNFDHQTDWLTDFVSQPFILLVSWPLWCNYGSKSKNMTASVTKCFWRTVWNSVPSHIICNADTLSLQDSSQSPPVRKGFLCKENILKKNDNPQTFSCLVNSLEK